MLKFINPLKQKIKTKLMNPFKPRAVCLKQVNYRESKFVVMANEDVGWRLITTGKYEPDELACLESLIREDDTCLDIGGNIGIYSVFMAKKAFKGKVVAFEPVPLNRRILLLNVTLNRVSNVDVLDCVISDRLGVVEFSISEDAAYSSLCSTQRKQETNKITVESKTLDELFESKGMKVDIIKIDVEGAELLVIKGAKNLLSNLKLRPRVMLIELSEENQAVYDYMPNDIIDYMKLYGYVVYSISNNRIIKGWPHQDCLEDVLFVDASLKLDSKLFRKVR